MNGSCRGSERKGKHPASCKTTLWNIQCWQQREKCMKRNNKQKAWTPEELILLMAVRCTDYGELNFYVDTYAVDANICTNKLRK